MTFSDADYSRMSDLENASRLADLEIERTPLKDVGNLDIANMTAGEIVTLANVMEAVHVLTDAFKRDAQEYAGYSPATSERRSQTFDNRAGRFAPNGGGASYYDRPASGDNESEESLRKLREYLTERLSEAPPMVNTVSGPIKVTDIPRTEDGQIVAGWLEENCTCDDHEKQRIDADKQKATGIGDPTIATGLYL